MSAGTRMSLARCSCSQLLECVTCTREMIELHLRVLAAQHHSSRAALKRRQYSCFHLFTTALGQLRRSSHLTPDPRYGGGFLLPTARLDSASNGYVYIDAGINVAAAFDSLYCPFRFPPDVCSGEAGSGDLTVGSFVQAQ